MNNKLLNLSYILVFIGISILFIINKVSTINNSSISSINIKDLDKTVKISGSISSIRNLNSISILTVHDKTGSISITIFKPNIQLNKDNFIEIEGKVSKYQNKPQIIANSIKVI